MKLGILLVSLSFFSCNEALAQKPRYTSKNLVAILDSTEFKIIKPKKDGFLRSYVNTGITYFDIDDDSTTLIKANGTFVLCIEGQLKDNKREGLFTFYLIDMDDHSRRYKIWEQMFKNDSLNGSWKTYTLRGTLKESRMFRGSSFYGVGRDYWIDGKTIMSETEIINGDSDYIEREYHENNKLKSEIRFKNGKPNGIGKKYYPDGTLQEYAEFKDAEFDGTRRYYYENGQLWIEQTYKAGKSWDVIANYTRDGKKRDAGTLKNGNGTIIFYDENGSIRETKTFVNGELKQ